MQRNEMISSSYDIGVQYTQQAIREQCTTHTAANAQLTGKSTIRPYHHYSDSYQGRYQFKIFYFDFILVV